MGFFLLKHEFETVVVNEPWVFEPLKFYCTINSDIPPPKLKRKEAHTKPDKQSRKTHSEPKEQLFSKQMVIQQP